MARSDGPTVFLRIRLLEPPVGVAFAVQIGKSDAAGAAELAPPSKVDAGGLDFDMVVRPAAKPDGSPPDLKGPAVQGPRGARFVYVNSGRRAGQPDSPWDRRAKVPLSGIDWTLIEAALATPAGRLEARIAGVDRKGGPACATVPLLDGGWRVVSDAAA